MEMIDCPNCKAKILSTDEICPICQTQTLAVASAGTKTDFSGAYEFAYDEMEKGNSQVAIISMLEEKGYDEKTIDLAVKQSAYKISLENQKEREKKKASNDLIYGLLWLMGGIAVTAVTYMLASGGGVVFVAWGAMIFGGVQFIRGLISYYGKD